MNDVPIDVESSIEQFAVVSARLHDPFASPAGVLAEASLDGPRWRRATLTWASRFEEDTPEARTLATAFSDAYAQARRGGDKVSAVAAAQGTRNAGSAHFLNREPTPWQAEAEAVATSIEEDPTDPDMPQIPPTAASKPLLPSCLLPSTSAPTPLASPPRRPIQSETAELDDFFPRVDLPFRPGDFFVASRVVKPPEVKRSSSRRRIETNTTELSPADRKPALPFPGVDPTRASASASHHGKRLVLFDPQTGQRLAAPRWEDVLVASPTSLQGQRK